MDRQQQKLWLRSGILEEHWNLTLEDFKLDQSDQGYASKVKALDITNSYVANLLNAKREGIGLLYFGTHGAGKTLLGICILKAALNQGFSAQFSSLGTIVQTLSEGWYDDSKRRMFEERVKKVDFLMIDDLGKEFKSKNGLTEIVFDNIIRYRSFRNKPTLMTTNTSLEAINSLYGNSVLSLLAGKYIPVKVVGSDYRKEVLASTLIKRLTED